MHLIEERSQLLRCRSPTVTRFASAESAPPSLQAALRGRHHLIRLLFS